jgi:hypothetical protein
MWDQVCSPSSFPKLTAHRMGHRTLTLTSPRCALGSANEGSLLNWLDRSPYPAPKVRCLGSTWASSTKGRAFGAKSWYASPFDDSLGNTDASVVQQEARCDGEKRRSLCKSMLSSITLARMSISNQAQKATSSLFPSSYPPRSTCSFTPSSSLFPPSSTAAEPTVSVLLHSGSSEVRRPEQHIARSARQQQQWGPGQAGGNIWRFPSGCNPSSAKATISTRSQSPNPPLGATAVISSSLVQLLRAMLD